MPLIKIRLVLLLALMVVLASSNVYAINQTKINRDNEAEKLCRDKAQQAASSIAKINTPNSTQTAAAVKVIKKNKIEFSLAFSHDDKTKSYSVTGEFSLENKWCQIIDVRLVGVPE